LIKKSITIVIANHKGGVEKTTTYITLGYGLAGLGYHITLIDCDVQGHVAPFLGLENKEETFYTVSTHSLRTGVYPEMCYNYYCLDEQKNGAFFHAAGHNLLLGAKRPLHVDSRPARCSSRQRQQHAKGALCYSTKEKIK